MAINVQKVAIAGAASGVATGFILKLLMPVLNWVGTFLPTLSVKLASPETIEVNIRESLTGVNSGMAKWFADMLGLTVPTNIYMPYVMAAIGGAILFVAGAYIAEALKLLEGTAVKKTTTVLFIGSILVVFVLKGFEVPAINWGLANTVIALGVNAFALSWLYTVLDPHGKLLVPF